jgi:regulator of nucleoside diphosphate kinase
MSAQHRTTALADAARPRITLSLNDYERLSLLARAAESRMPDLVAALAEDLERAHVLPNGAREQTVFMGSEVEFRDDSGKVQTVTLVYPGDADISLRRISVLTPVGAALIGLSAGDSVTCETRNGDARELTVLKVRDPQLAVAREVLETAAVHAG